MANNRMWLMHVPTGLAVGLGKRQGYGWRSDRPVDMGTFYRVLEEDYGYRGRQDDFALLMEDDEEAPWAEGLDWQYGPERADGLMQIIFTAKAHAE